MLLGSSKSLPSLVEANFKAAKASSSLIFSPTELAIIKNSGGVPFQLRYCPALAKKPEPKEEKDNDTRTKKPDPFDNPHPDLLIAEIPHLMPSHVLVLNKFPVIPEHFILATRTNKQQTHKLEQNDLEMTYACLKAWESDDARGQQRRLFAFFNSGDHSGASQPHRHLQFLPIESMQQGQQSDDWSLLLDLILSSPLDGPSIPFKHFVCRLPVNPSGSHLLETYNILYDKAHAAVDEYRATSPDFSLHDESSGSLPISYNLAMTKEGMAIMPRRSEGSALLRDDGTEVGFVALNGTALGGTLMVKYEEEFELLQREPAKLDSILEAIGFPQPR